MQEFGRLLLMVTVDRSSANQFVVAVRAGLQESDVKFGEAWNLSDVFDKENPNDLPNEWIIRSVAGKDHAIAAQYFIMMDFFLKKLLDRI